jgi:hypothetical protein
MLYIEDGEINSNILALLGETYQNVSGLNKTGVGNSYAYRFMHLSIL